MKLWAWADIKGRRPEAPGRWHAYQDELLTGVVEERIYQDRLEELIRWLAMPYQNGNPCFSFAQDINGNTIEATPTQARLLATWLEVVGDRGFTRPGGWDQCKCCGMWQMVNLPEEVTGGTT